MKVRTLPFGYRYENCEISIHHVEAQVLKRIITDYLNGQSLLKIANVLNAEKIEYMPGIFGWNKARIMRIVEDKRYLGGEGYPQLVDEETHSNLITQKSNKNKLKNVDRQADIFKLSVPVLCPRCGVDMTRYHDSRYKRSDYWKCNDRNCHKIVRIRDDSLLNSITELLNKLIIHPEQITDIKPQIYEPTTAITKIENDIIRGVENATIDINSLKLKMLECVALKYKSLPSERNTAERLRVDFALYSPLAVFSVELTNKTVAAIQFGENCAVQLVLRNGQIIRKE